MAELPPYGESLSLTDHIAYHDALRLSAFSSEQQYFGLFKVSVSASGQSEEEAVANEEQSPAYNELVTGMRSAESLGTLMV